MKLKDFLDASLAGFDVNTNVEVYNAEEAEAKGWDVTSPIWANNPPNSYGEEKWSYEYEQLEDCEITYVTTNIVTAAIVIEVELPKEYEVSIHFAANYRIKVNASSKDEAKNKAYKEFYSSFDTDKFGNVRPNSSFVYKREVSENE